MLLLVNGTTYAGSATAYLKCKSASGRSAFTAQVENITGDFISAELTIDSQTITFTRIATDCQVIWDNSSAVYTLHLADKTLRNGPYGNWVQFWAVPYTFKKNEKGNYEFDAFMNASDPRGDEGHAIDKVKLHCILEYKQ